MKLDNKESQIRTIIEIYIKTEINTLLLKQIKEYTGFRYVLTVSKII
jgi:hypothetical protein